jgi:predicted enzyme related to lactoylglutathione lyase
VYLRDLSAPDGERHGRTRLAVFVERDVACRAVDEYEPRRRRELRPRDRALGRGLGPANDTRCRAEITALDFYTNALGFEKRADNPTPDGARFLAVGITGQDFQLVLWPGTPGQAQAVQGRVPASCTIETPNCRETFEALKARGVKFETEILEYPWGYIAVFEDPDGNRLQLREGRR